MLKISVIATVLNEVETIDDLVSCLTRQTLRPAEIIIVDGGSSDGTWEKLQSLQSAHTNLIAIRDESCNLKYSAGPIARGRNQAISRATSPAIACADAGCRYLPDWLAKLTEPILTGETQYALGGSCLDDTRESIWDLAAAPFLGIRSAPDAKHTSCTARSMAFTRELWSHAGGFPEATFLGEDTLMDQKLRHLAQPVFVRGAMAQYAPRLTFRSAIRQFARYSSADGSLGIRRSRFIRMLSRCLLEVMALVLLPLTWIPLVCVGILEMYFAFARDVSTVRLKRLAPALGTRILFSLMVPWIFVISYVSGGLSARALKIAQTRTAEKSQAASSGEE